MEVRGVDGDLDGVSVRGLDNRKMSSHGVKVIIIRLPQPADAGLGMCSSFCGVRKTEDVSIFLRDINAKNEKVCWNFKKGLRSFLLI